MIRLWIKGSVEVAQEAAKARNIPIQDIAYIGKRSTTMCNVKDHKHYLGVVEWFNEEVPCVDGQGYPAGTLLLYA